MAQFRTCIREEGPWGTRTPIDILYQLFTMANKETPTAAIVVSQVCKRWREFAVASPTLWTKISMFCILPNRKHLWTITYLERSQTMPVSLHLKASRCLTPQEIESVFIRYAHRFRYLSVQASNYHLSLALWPQLSQALPSGLTRFEYRIISDMQVHIERNALATGPFRIAGVSRNGAIEWGNWNTSSITTLKLNYIRPEATLSVGAYRAIFTHCRGTLAHLELLGFAPSDDKNRPVPRITLPALETLSLGFIDNILPFVQLIDTPVLRSFTLRNIVATPENSGYEPLQHWRSRMWGTSMARVFELMHGMPLTHLAIYGEMYGPAVEFRGFLLSLTKLKSLELYASANLYYDIVFDSEVLIPSLSDLLITSAHHIRYVDAFLRRRMTAGLPSLRKLTITKDGVSFLMNRSDKHLIIEGCSTITAIADPILYTRNVADGERDLMVGGVFVKEFI